MLNDLRFAIRVFARRRVFSITAVLTLALGIGLTTAVFSIVDGVLFRPLPYEDPDRLYVLFGAQRTAKEPQSTMGVSLPEFKDLQRSRSFEQIAAFETAQGPQSQIRGIDEPIQVVTASVSAEFFGVLGVRPAVGRDFTSEEYASQPATVALISDSLWRRAFGGDNSVIGKTIIRGEETLTVVGVLPQRFVFPVARRRFQPDVLIPTLRSAQLSASRNYRFLTLIGRLAPDVSVEQARAEMEGIALQIAPLYVPGKAIGDIAFDGITIRRLGDYLTAASRPVLSLVFGAVVTLFVIACVNVLSLLLARQADRQQEIAIRRAIGAARSRIARQFVIESAVLATAAGIAGWLIAHATFQIAVSRIPAWLQLVGEPRMDTRALGLTLIAGISTVVACGVLPALAPSWLRSQDMKPTPSRQMSRRGRGTWILVGMEVALATVLLAAGAIMLHSWMRLQAEDSGVEAERLIAIRSEPAGPFNPQARTQYAQRVVERLRAVPGVESVAMIDAPILSRAMRGSRFVPPFMVKYAGAGMDTDLLVTPGYFETMGIPIRQGRALTEGDRGRAVVISETTARRYWPTRTPVGEVIKYGDELRHVVGVAGDVRDFAMDGPAMSNLYHVWDDATGLTPTVMLRFSGPSAPVTAQARAAVRQVDADAIVTMLGTYNELLGRSVAERSFNTILFAVFAAAGLLIALVGVFGIVAVHVAQRERELAIRAALGASPTRLKKLVVGVALRPVFAGLIAGIVGSLLLARYLRPFVYGIEATDTATLLVVAGMFTLVAIAASYVPARRAAGVDPMVVLRAE